MVHKCPLCGKSYKQESAFNKHVTECKLRKGYYDKSTTSDPSIKELVRMNMYLFRELERVKNELSILKRFYNPGSKKRDILLYLNECQKSNIDFNMYINEGLVVDEYCIEKFLDSDLKDAIDVLISKNFSFMKDEDGNVSTPIVYLKESNSFYVNVLRSSITKEETEEHDYDEDELTWIKITRADPRFTTIKNNLQKAVFKKYKEWKSSLDTDTVVNSSCMMKILSLAKRGKPLKLMIGSLMEHAALSISQD